MVNVHDEYAEFRFYRPGARNVFLVGSFNGWNPYELRMTPAGDGYWEATLRLAPGTYRFRYQADGQWLADYAAFGITYGPYGADSVVHIQRRQADWPAGPSALRFYRADSPAHTPEPVKTLAPDAAAVLAVN